MEKGSGGGEPATSVAGGMCDRFLTFLARNLTMSRIKSIADAPSNGSGGGGGGDPPPERGEEDDDNEEEDDFAIPIERAEFDDHEVGGHGGGEHSTVATILEAETAATAAATKTGAADDGGPAEAAEPAPPAVEETTTKVRKTVTIKEDRAKQEGDVGSAPAAPLERKRSLFRKRQASSLDGGGEPQGGATGRVPRRAGLRPRMPAVLRVPSNINERSSTFIEERRKSFGGRGGTKTPATAK